MYDGTLRQCSVPAGTLPAFCRVSHHELLSGSWVGLGWIPRLVVASNVCSCPCSHKRDLASRAFCFDERVYKLYLEDGVFKKGTIMNYGDTVAVLKSDRKTLLASGRVIEMNGDNSKIRILVENSIGLFRLGQGYFFELIENDDGTYEALYLEPLPGTCGMVRRLEFPRFVIGGALQASEEDYQKCVQAVLF